MKELGKRGSYASKSVIYIVCCYINNREEMIAQNMKNMPQMVEEFRKKRRELRNATREKKTASEERRYLLATGQLKEEPAWQLNKKDGQDKKGGKK